MDHGYKIIIRGVQAGQVVETVADALAARLRQPVAQVLPALQAGLPIAVSLKGLPLRVARAWKESVDKTGCVSVLDSLAPWPAEITPLPGDFSTLGLRLFSGPQAGLMLNAPADWRAGHDEKLFRLQHSGTKTWWTGSCTPSPGVSLPVWAEIRFGVVAEKMAYLKPFCAPYCLATQAGQAFVAEFRGWVPGDAEPTHQLVLCLCTEAAAISLNITADVAEFEQHRALYQWLLRTQLQLLVIGSPMSGAAVAQEPPEAFWQRSAWLAEGARRVAVRYGEYTFMARRAYYSTGLTNLSDRPVRVLKFGGFVSEDGQYRLANFSGDWFTAQNFIDWYGAPADGWIAPGESAADETNWGGAEAGFWAYWCTNDLGECFMAMAHRPPSRTGGSAFGLRERPAGLPADPWQPCPETIRRMLARNVERCQALFTDNDEPELSFDEEGLARIEAVIERARRVSEPAQCQELIQVFGAFLGECLLRKGGGDWWRYDEVICVRAEEETAYPFNKVMKQFINGLEGGDSVLGLYRTVGLFVAKPLSERQRKFAALIKAHPEYRYFIPDGTPEAGRWLPVGALEGGWVVIQGPGGPAGARESRMLHQIEQFRVTDAAGGLIDLDRSPLPPQAATAAAPASAVAARSKVVEHPADAVMADAMARLRTAFDASRGLFNRYSFESIKAQAPSWLKPSDALYKILDQQLLLCSEGQIVWAGLIQANSLLFKPGDADCPANLVYSADPYFDARPKALHALAREIFRLKNTVPVDEEARRIAQVITDEADRSMMAWKVPASLTDHDVLAGTFMVFRKHIPNGVLSAGCFPILMHPQTDAVMIVPFEFWPIELIKLWKTDQL